MTNPDWNLQVKISHGQATSSLPDTGAHHRAIEIARQLLAIGQWLDYLNTLIVIQTLTTLRLLSGRVLHRRLQLSGAGTYQADFNVVVYPAAHELQPGQDYEVIYMSDSFRELHNL